MTSAVWKLTRLCAASRGLRHEAPGGHELSSGILYSACRYLATTSALRQETNASTAANATSAAEPVLGKSGQTLVGSTTGSIPVGAATAVSEAGKTASSEAGKSSTLLKALKITLGLALASAGGSCAYVTYAYDTDTLSAKLAEARSLCSSPASSASRDDAESEQGSAVREKLLRLAASAGVLDMAQFYVDSRRTIEEQIQGFSAPSSDKLLPDLAPSEQHVYTLVLDLNDTLVHSDWKRDRGWRTFKRPGVEPFLERMAHYFEIVVFSDQLNITVDPILDRLDTKGCIRYRLYRDATQYTNGHYIRDLSKLNRDPARVMYITGDPESCVQGANMLHIPAWKLDAADTALLDHLPFLESQRASLAVSRVPDQPGI
eukprot:jgi/Mesen1/3883/ME000208S02889